MAIKNFREYNDALINKGQVFSQHATHTFPGPGNTTFVWLLTTDAVVPAHLQKLEFYSNCADPVTIEVYENATVTAAGTALVELQRDRRTTTTTVNTTTATYTPTTIADGTLLFKTIIDTGNPIWDPIDKIKMILRENSNIHIKATDVFALGATIGFNATWVEPRSVG